MTIDTPDESLTPLDYALKAVEEFSKGDLKNLSETASEELIGQICKEGCMSEVEARKLYTAVYRVVHDMMRKNDADDSSI